MVGLEHIPIGSTRDVKVKLDNLLLAYADLPVHPLSIPPANAFF